MSNELEIIADDSVIEPLELWSSSSFLVTNPYHNLLKDSLQELIYKDAASSSTAIKSDVAVAAKRHLLESGLGFLDSDDANIQSLHLYITDLIRSVAEEVNQPFWPEEAETEASLTESWYHITRNGGYHDVHSHPNCSWCGIYYLEVGNSSMSERNGVNRFYDPRVNAGQFLDAGSQYIDDTGVWDISPTEGQIIVFPSYLKHSALPYFGDKDRVVIAFNARVDFI